MNTPWKSVEMGDGKRGVSHVVTVNLLRACMNRVIANSQADTYVLCNAQFLINPNRRGEL
jgi:hypothetical protein